MKCSGCGKCCQNLSLTLAEFERLHKKFPVLASKADFYGFAYEFKGKCPFLSPENRCIAYEDRPRVCRMFPVIVIGSEGNNLKLGASPFCPNRESVSTTDIADADILRQEYNTEMAKDWSQYQLTHPNAMEEALKFLGSEKQRAQDRSQDSLSSSSSDQNLTHEDKLETLVTSYSDSIKKKTPKSPKK